jgi:hypothetical protein
MLYPQKDKKDKRRRFRQGSGKEWVMNGEVFSPADIGQIEEKGLTAERVYRQVEMIATGPRYLHVLRPCTRGDGIKVLDREASAGHMNLHEAEARKGRFLKFVPASGAASRMFKSLHRYADKLECTAWSEISAEADRDQKDAKEVVRFINELDRFAFFNEVQEAMQKMGGLPGENGAEKSFAAVLRTVLSEKGLGYGLLPKGLLKFHKYGHCCRTSFEEHLVEAAAYVADGNKKCRIHFTVSREHMDLFLSLYNEVRPYYERRHGVEYDVSFSIQQPSTDTIALNDENEPFRDEKGRLLFRPGGHGALLQNLNDLKGDLVFMKNIDNVAPDHLKPPTVRWKKLMAGYLIQLQGQIFRYLEWLSTTRSGNELFKEIGEFIEGELYIPLSHASVKNWDQATMRAAFYDTLNRPLRVCGMVKNEGEPGGGPFWVQSSDGRVSLQIVESAQINPASRDQAEIWASATHFNPVDIVCGLMDWRGKPFDLTRYVDPQTFLVSRKSSGGKTLKALELPGLWNGAMARWITVFVEIPVETFSPVKTVTDLLRREHQPPEPGES